MLSLSANFLACILHEGNESQGKSGTKSPGAILDARKRGPAGARRMDAPSKQGRTIARRPIAVAMGQGGSFEIGSQICDVRHPWRTPLRGCCASQIRILRICPEFVQVQTVLDSFFENSFYLFYIYAISQEFVPPSCNMQAIGWQR